MIDWHQMIAPEARAADLLASACETARTSVREWIAGVVQGLTGNAPLTEMLSWSAKEEAARAWLADPTTPVPGLLAGEAQVTGEDPAVLAARVVAIADAWRAAQAMLTGLRRRADTALAKAATPAEVTATLQAIMADAEGIARKLGAD